MIIANPIYDTIFKYLMKDLDIAKGFISRILDINIISLRFSDRENSRVLKEATDISERISLFHLDFIAEVETDEGSKSILIELQKTYDSLDIHRFRTYLGEEYARIHDEYVQYKKDFREAIKEAKENDTSPNFPSRNLTKALPIVTIYILNFNLSLKKMILHVEPVYKDPNNKNEILNKKDDFIDKLTHNAYFIQAPSIPDVPKTSLEQILSIFNQNFLTPDSNWKIDYQKDIDRIDDELLKSMLIKLKLLVVDKKIATELESREAGRNYMEEHDFEWVQRLAEKEALVEIEKSKRIESDDRRKEADDRRKESDDRRKEADNKAKEEESRRKESDNKLKEADNKLKESDDKAEEERLKRKESDNKAEEERLKRKGVEDELQKLRELLRKNELS